MNIPLSRTLLTTLMLGFAVANPASAEKPAWAGGGKEGKENKHVDYDEGRGGGKKPSRDKHSHSGGTSISIGAYFGSSQRQAAHEYYGSEFRAGHCPPGLAKKGNGCMPPGQAKKWSMGHPLPSSVIYYGVPATVIARLGPPPSGHKYVRVASDILLIAIGTGMVVDAIQDLGSM